MLAALFINCVQAQSIKGKIQNSNGDAIQSATISVMNTQKIAATDKFGNFTILNIPGSTYQLEISSIGFANQIKQIHVASDKTTEVTIVLEEQSKQLEDVVVSAEKREEKLQKTPIAISVLNAQQLKNYRTWDVSADATTLDPNTPFSLVTNNPTHNRGISFFGQLGYHLSSKWNITLGGRVDNEKRTLSQYIDSVKNNIAARITTTDNYNNSYSKFTPKIILSYQATELQMLYASYAKGYRVGGFNAGQPSDKIVYNPENSDNFELGYKSTFLDNKLRLNVALFYLYLKGHQVSTTNDGFNYYYLNLGNFKSTGVETELTGILAKGLQAQWNFSYTDGKFTKLQLFDDATGKTKDYSGNKIIFAPPITSMLTLQYNYQLQKNKAGISLFARGEWRHVGKYYFDYYNVNKQNAYGLLDARLGLTANKFDIAFWVRNLTNKRYVTYGSQSPSFNLFMVSNPRMWGITLTGKF